MNKKELQEVRIELVNNIEKYHREYRKHRQKVIKLRNCMYKALKYNKEQAEAYGFTVRQHMLIADAVREEAKIMSSRLLYLFELERKAS